MLFDFEDYSGESDEVLLPLLISERSQALLLAAVEYMQHSYAWVDGDDASNFDNIDEAVSSAISEIILEVTGMDLTPIGIIVAFVGEIADIPAKWLLCNGSTKNNADYPELASIMPPIWDGATQFVLPDLRQYYIRGSADDTAVGSSGGSDTITLTVANLPAHSHIVPAHSHNVAKGAAVASQNARAAQANNTALGDQATSTHPATDTSDTGSGDAFDNRPRSIHMHYIIKALP